MRRHPPILAALIALCSLAPAARAGEKEARARFERAQLDYKLGRFEEALEGYRGVYEELPLPELLFNIGQCYRQLANCERALFFYQSYLRDHRAPANKKLAQELIGECERKLAAEQAAATPVLAPEPGRAEDAALAPLIHAPPPESEAPVYERWWFWGIVGIAAVASGAAVVWAASPSPPVGSLGSLDVTR